MGSSARLILITARFALLTALLFLLAACGDGAGPKAEPAAKAVPRQRIAVVCTTPILAEVVTRLAGGSIDVTCLLEPGDRGDEGSLRAGDAIAIRDADLVLMHGPRAEGALGQTIAALAKPEKVVHASQNQPAGDGPHACAIPGNYLAMVEAVQASLARLDPDHTSRFESQASELKKEIASLGDWIAQASASTPKLRTVITNRAVFAAIVRSLGWQVVLVDFDHRQSPVQQDHDRLLAAVKESKANAIAIDGSDSEALAEMLQSIAKVTGAKVVSPPIVEWPAPPGGYVAMMKANVTALVEAMSK